MSLGGGPWVGHTPTGCGWSIYKVMVGACTRSTLSYHTRACLISELMIDWATMVIKGSFSLTDPGYDDTDPLLESLPPRSKNQGTEANKLGSLKQPLSAHDISRVQGKIKAVSQSVSSIPLFYRHIQRDLTKVLQ